MRGNEKRSRVSNGPWFHGHFSLCAAAAAAAAAFGHLWESGQIGQGRAEQN